MQENSFSNTLSQPSQIQSIKVYQKLGKDNGENGQQPMSDTCYKRYGVYNKIFESLINQRGLVNEKFIMLSFYRIISILKEMRSNERIECCESSEKTKTFLHKYVQYVAAEQTLES